jgi:hypothetical protein
MAPPHKVEVFSAGCAVCQEAVQEIRREASLSSWEVVVLDMHDPGVAARAKDLGIRSVPAVLIDGRIADWGRGLGLADLAGLWWR